LPDVLSIGAERPLLSIKYLSICDERVINKGETAYKVRSRGYSSDGVKKQLDERETVVGRETNGDKIFRVFGVRVAGAVVELQTKFFGANAGGSERGEISCFSPASRRRLFKTLAAINFEVLGPSLFITLTYPREFSLNGQVVKRDLDNFRRLWTHRYGSCVGAWKMEFQARGAVHFHLALRAPVGVPLVVLRHDMSAVWFQIVGSGDLRHLQRGFSAEPLRDHPAAYFAGYVGFSKGSKEYQHSVPEGFEHVGRFWGLWKLAPEWKTEMLYRDEFVQLRRLTRAWCKSQKFYSGRCGRMQSEWLHVRDTSALLLVHQLSRGLPVDLFVT
jgi:hypothetical protein